MADPGASGFCALAELYRRSGRLDDAESVARAGLVAKPDAWEGRVALALVLLDRGCEIEAREELERLMEEGASLQGISLAEMPASAEAVDAPFAPHETLQENSLPEPEAISVGAPFATGTMADLLERQGDVRGAEQIRASLEIRPAGPATGERKASVIEELSRWLANAQRRVAERP